MGTENGSPDSFGKSLATTRVGLGCASLHHLPTHSQRQSLLRCAFEHGIRYFDCARMYGNGLAEREVGVLANDHRSAMIIATKLGIPANATLERFPVLQYPAKITRRLFGFLRHGLSPPLRVDQIAQAVAQQIEAEHRDHQRQAWK